MEIQVTKLGKVAVTVADDFWSIAKAYDKLTIVEDEGVAVYMSKIPVPKGVSLTNTKYWQKLTNINGQGGGGSTNDFTDTYKDAVDDYINKKENLSLYVNNDKGNNYIYDMVYVPNPNGGYFRKMVYKFGESKQQSPTFVDLNLPLVTNQLAGILSAADYNKFNNIYPTLLDSDIAITSTHKNFNLLPGVYKIESSFDKYPSKLFDSKIIGTLVVSNAVMIGTLPTQYMILLSAVPMTYPTEDSIDYGYPNLSPKFTISGVEKYVRSGVYVSYRELNGPANTWNDWKAWQPTIKDVASIAQELIEDEGFVTIPTARSLDKSAILSSLVTNVFTGVKRPTATYWYLYVPGQITADEFKVATANRLVHFINGNKTYNMAYNASENKFTLYDYSNNEEVVTLADNYSTIEATITAIDAARYIYMTTIKISKTE